MRIILDFRWGGWGMFFLRGLMNISRVCFLPFHHLNDINISSDSADSNVFHIKRDSYDEVRRMKNERGGQSKATRNVMCMILYVKFCCCECEQYFWVFSASLKIFLKSQISAKIRKVRILSGRLSIWHNFLPAKSRYFQKLIIFRLKYFSYNFILQFQLSQCALHSFLCLWIIDFFPRSLLEKNISHRHERKGFAISFHPPSKAKLPFLVERFSRFNSFSHRSESFVFSPIEHRLLLLRRHHFIPSFFVFLISHLACVGHRVEEL